MGSNNDISLKALAKINLGLDVVRRREDGYHEVRMIMQTIYLYDKLDIKRTKEPGIQIQTNLSFLPVNEKVHDRTGFNLGQVTGLKESV